VCWEHQNSKNHYYIGKAVALISTWAPSPKLFPEIRNAQSFFKHQNLFMCKLFPENHLGDTFIHSEDKSASIVIIN
jgi:hypothetical protein